MIAPNPNSICDQARVYYYDYLLGEPREVIPKGMITHIDKCQRCHNEVKRLKFELVENAAHADKSIVKTNSIITTGLRLHFAYIGAFVTCETVRPFLPSLADHVLEVGVPTPITVHLDKCQQCANDLETVRQLNFTHRQLCRLGQLFAEKPGEDAISCSQVRTAILAVVTMVFRETNAEVLKHLCTCPDCREQLYQYRETVRGKLLDDQRTQKGFPCEAISATEIFDYCFPYGIDPANDQYAKFRPSFTSHARGCPTCLAKMQELHNTVYSILQRPESGIVTCFKVRDRVGVSMVESCDDMYEGWPIEVQVFDKSTESDTIEARDSGVAVPHKPKQRAPALNLRQFIKPAAAAAAILVVALLLVFNGPVAKAVDLGQIYKALEQIKNVCFTTFDTEEARSTGEVWISRTLAIKIFKRANRCALWDLRNKYKQSKDLNTGSITMVELNDDALVEVRETMESPWGLLPFDDISSVPEDAKWLRVADEGIEVSIPGTEVYDLIWIEKRLGGSINYNKWRGYIDTKSKLPMRVERWEKLAEEKEYELKTIMEVTYPDTVEIRAIIKDVGF